MRPPRPGVWLLDTATTALAVDTQHLFSALLAPSTTPVFWLDSARAAYGTGRWSFLGRVEHELDHVLVLDRTAGALRLRGADGTTTALPAASGADLWDALAERIAANPVDPGDLDLPFTGGYVGYVGYGAKDIGDPTRTDPAGRDAELLHVTRFLAVDHLEGVVHAVAVGPADQRPAARRWALETAARVRDLAPGAGPAAAPAPGPGTAAVDPPPGAGLARPSATSSVGAEEYLAALGAVGSWLLAGESYEACYTHLLTFRSAEDPSQVYRRLRASNPAPYAAFLRSGSRAVLSSSPERFLRVSTAGWAETKPIKGTAPRAEDPAEDAEIARRLVRDPKTRAENLMIVDLLRNDLGLICDPGSVHVPELMAVETYATVHQLVTTVRGHLRPVPAAAVRAAQALFPGGSMTGAPKERTVQLLDGLEAAPRGVYSGVLGYFSRSGSADLSVVIRTAVIDDGAVAVGAGGAVTVASTPLAERAEAQLKARPLLDAAGVAHPFIPDPPGGATRQAAGDAPREAPGGAGGTGGDGEGRLLVADSWLVLDGAVRGLELHRARFLRAVPAPARPEAETFLDAVAASLPRTGAWFPRIECREGAGGPTFRLLQRPETGRRTTAVVLTHPGPDPRTTPAVKGPDLAALGAAVERARERGADEPVLLSEHGHVVEAAWSSLLWWQDGELRRPAADLPRVASVTAALVTRLAAEIGIPVVDVRARPEDLAGAELWSLNARHGIRVVTAWVGGPALVRSPGRWERWSAMLAGTAEPLG